MVDLNDLSLLGQELDKSVMIAGVARHGVKKTRHVYLSTAEKKTDARDSHINLARGSVCLRRSLS